MPETLQLDKERIPIEDSYINFFRLIRSDRQLNIFGERFTVSKDLVYEYVKATICTDSRRQALVSLSQDRENDEKYYTESSLTRIISFV